MHLHSESHDAHGAADLPTTAADGAEPPSRPALRTPQFSLIGWVREVLGLTGRESSLREVLEEVLEEHEQDATHDITTEQRNLLQNVLSFGETTVSDVMVPLPDMVAVSFDAPFEDIKHVVLESRHTRIPVYQETIDHIRGFLHAKDLIAVMTSAHAFDMESIIRPMLFVPPGMRIVDLLVEMKRARVHMAIVVDEFGGTRGLVTLEDLFEELVGDIQDEHDTEEDSSREAFDFDRFGALELEAKTRLDDMPETLALLLRPEDEAEAYDTLGGLVSYQLGRVPEAGEEIQLASGYRVEIIEADARRVIRVRLVQPRADAPNDSD